MTVEVTRTDEGMRLAKLDLFFVELLRQIPISADPGDCATALNRIYPVVTRDPDASEANEDWRSYVHPELRQLFSSAAQTVKEDLEVFDQLDENQEHWAFDIPVAHFEQWLNVLNQARLVLAARFDFQDEEMNQGGSRAIETVRDLSLFQIHFYSFIQECLLQDIGQ